MIEMPYNAVKIKLTAIVVAGLLVFAGSAFGEEYEPFSERNSHSAEIYGNSITPEASAPGQYVIRNEYGQRTGTIVKDNVWDNQYIVRDDLGRKTGIIVLPKKDR